MFLLSLVVLFIAFHFMRKILSLKQARCRFYRSFYEARQVQFTLAGVCILFAIMQFTPMILGLTIRKGDIILPLLIALAIIILSFIEYKMTGEGLYDDGIIIGGFVYKWSQIVSYKIIPFKDDETKSKWTLTLKKKNERIFYRSITIFNEDAERLNRNMTKGLELKRNEE